MYRICHPCDYRTCRFQYVIELKAAMIDFNELNQSRCLFLFRNSKINIKNDGKTAVVSRFVI